MSNDKGIYDSVISSFTHIFADSTYNLTTTWSHPQGFLSYWDGDEKVSSPVQYDKMPWG